MPVKNDKVITFPPKTVIFRQGDAPDYGYVVLSGEVEISAKGKDGRIVLTTVTPHQLFGELALMENTPRSATATSINGCTVMAVTRGQFLKKLEVLDPFSRYWILYLSDRVKDLSLRAHNQYQNQ
jgi:CRP-like cAMP-binding protein